MCVCVLGKWNKVGEFFCWGFLVSVFAHMVLKCLPLSSYCPSHNSCPFRAIFRPPTSRKPTQLSHLVLFPYRACHHFLILLPKQLHFSKQVNPMDSKDARGRDPSRSLLGAQFWPGLLDPSSLTSPALASRALSQPWPFCVSPFLSLRPSLRVSVGLSFLPHDTKYSRWPTGNIIKLN